MWVLNALAKLSSSKAFQLHKEVKAVLEEYSASNDTDVWERAMEYRKLAKYNAALRISDTLVFDPAMPFLKGFVDEARKKGAKEYQSNMAVNKVSDILELKFTPYVMNREGKVISTNPKSSEDT
ncbi:MAG: hypothetical protein JST59_00770 [Actinobacteria bacterium]|nr:hypothetical protein [Actinomycetota bacterium]